MACCSSTSFRSVFDWLDEDPEGLRSSQTVAAELEGGLLRSRPCFAYLMLVAFEAPWGVARFAAMLALAPLAWAMEAAGKEVAAVRLLAFVAFSGVRESDLTSAAKAVLPKFYAADVHPAAWRIFAAFGRRYVVTAAPRFMAEPFALQYLGADAVLGFELHILPGKSRRASGLLLPPRLPSSLAAPAPASDAAAAFRKPDVALVSSVGNSVFHSLPPSFLYHCSEGYFVPQHPKVEALPPSKLHKTLIFHDGRLVRKPTPLWALLTLIWLPMGFLLSVVRMITGIFLPMSIVYYGYWILGVRVIVKGVPPASVQEGKKKHGVLFVCTHRTLLDPIFVSTAVGRPVSALTYSLSRFSEFISPIPTVRLSRNRDKDAANIRELLKQGDLVICPEGTTCREPFLLRFSALFAELTDHIIPVATNCHMGMFHATSARGWKGLDSVFFFMNPSPIYEITFLNELPKELTCASGKSSIEVANYIQRTLAAALNFQCTNLTRKEKYFALAGHDGSVTSSSKS